jgi:DNA-binding beta-propeller fold protein YncE
VIRIPLEGRVKSLIDRRGDLQGNVLRRPNGLFVDGPGNVYVVGARSNNAFKVTAEGVITQLVDRLGPGDGHGLLFPDGIAPDAAGNTYVVGNNSANVLKVSPSGEVTLAAGPTWEGRALSAISAVAVAGDGTVYFTRVGPRSVWRIAPSGELTPVFDVSQLGEGQRLRSARGLVLDPGGDLYLAGYASHNVLRVTPAPIADTDADAP